MDAALTARIKAAVYAQAVADGLSWQEKAIERYDNPENLPFDGPGSGRMTLQKLLRAHRSPHVLKNTGGGNPLQEQLLLRLTNRN